MGALNVVNRWKGKEKGKVKEKVQVKEKVNVMVKANEKGKEEKRVKQMGKKISQKVKRNKMEKGKLNNQDGGRERPTKKEKIGPGRFTRAARAARSKHGTGFP